MVSFDELNKNDNTLVMHYTTTLLDSDPTLITGISIKILNEEQTDAIATDDEKENLQWLLNYLKEKQNYKIITWNQTSEKYGPLHIISRCKEHGLDYEYIQVNNFIDLDEMLNEEYGKPYLKCPRNIMSSKFITLANKNNITITDAQPGLMEIILYYQKNYKSIKSSVSRKTKILSHILEYQLKGELKVDWTQKRITKFLKKKRVIGPTVIAILISALFLMIDRIFP